MRTETSLQEKYLEFLKNKEVEVKCTLASGVCLRGTVTRFDENSLFLDNKDHGGQLINIVAISTIMPVNKAIAAEFASNITN